jgi:hypothetical protein
MHSPFPQKNSLGNPPQEYPQHIMDSDPKRLPCPLPPSSIAWIQNSALLFEKNSIRAIPQTKLLKRAGKCAQLRDLGGIKR